MWLEMSIIWWNVFLLAGNLQLTHGKSIHIMHIYVTCRVCRHVRLCLRSSNRSASELMHVNIYMWAFESVRGMDEWTSKKKEKESGRWGAKSALYTHTHLCARMRMYIIWMYVCMYAAWLLIYLFEYSFI